MVLKRERERRGKKGLSYSDKAGWYERIRAYRMSVIGLQTLRTWQYLIGTLIKFVLD